MKMIHPIDPSDIPPSMVTVTPPFTLGQPRIDAALVYDSVGRLAAIVDILTEGVTEYCATLGRAMTALGQFGYTMIVDTEGRPTPHQAGVGATWRSPTGRKWKVAKGHHHVGLHWVPAGRRRPRLTR